ncbi:hypothetical protein V6N11_005327 [Hibiscus sabdariffa]|uniref:Uncharacterized protein n=1 Tax=Hibiscus sabdariffa TaxID=183260 RepID=A0ABR2RMJ6_9ROSI
MTGGEGGRSFPSTPQIGKERNSFCANLIMLCWHGNPQYSFTPSIDDVEFTKSTPFKVSIIAPLFLNPKAGRRRVGKGEIIIILSKEQTLLHLPEKPLQHKSNNNNPKVLFHLLGLLAMSATIIGDAMVVSAPETQATSATAKPVSQIEVEFVKCDCCGLTEECTPTYIKTVRERYQGKWICGLCTEAVKDEIIRTQRLISTEEAMARHMSFCQEFVSAGPPPDPTVHLISAMRSILRRSLDCPRGLRSTPSSPTRKAGEIRGSTLARSESCFPALSS